MNVPVWAAETAAGFWEAAGSPEPFPRTLRGPLLRCPFDLTVKDLPHLAVRGVQRYLAGLGVAWACGGPDRRLRACLAAQAGAGFIFLDAEDEPPERVFSLAHELGHFLWHYWGPRGRACGRLGEGVAEVFDGRRPPTRTERARALLAGVPLGLHVHLMERGPRREFLSEEAAVAEEEADRLAYELLAPAADVLAAAGGEADRASVAGVLREAFGLPAAQAADYSGLLLPPPPVDPLLRRLKANG
jgi:hypothetical protein